MVFSFTHVHHFHGNKEIRNKKPYKRKRINVNVVKCQIVKHIDNIDKILSTVIILIYVVFQIVLPSILRKLVNA